MPRSLVRFRERRINIGAQARTIVSAHLRVLAAVPPNDGDALRRQRARDLFLDVRPSAITRGQQGDSLRGRRCVINPERERPTGCLQHGGLRCWRELVAGAGNQKQGGHSGNKRCHETQQT